jgi:hypothetical protein
MKSAFIYFFILLILSSSVSCKNKKDKLFTSLSHKRTGINFINSIKDNESFNVIDYVYLYDGTGVAVGDVNNDSLPDIFFNGNLSRSKLYLNKGNFRFEDITEKAGIRCGDTWNTGVTMIDINNDGFLYIYVCSSTDSRPEHRKNLLFINNGKLQIRKKERTLTSDF